MIRDAMILAFDAAADRRHVGTTGGFEAYRPVARGDDYAALEQAHAQQLVGAAAKRRS